MIQDIKVENGDSVGTAEAFGNIELMLNTIVINMGKDVAKMVHKGLEELLYDEDSWNVNLQKKVDELQVKVADLEETNIDLGWRRAI